MSEPITLCIIDDIRTVVNGIVKQIDWPAHGIEIVGTASNGEDGMELIRRTRPHIILTDIRMPRMDGLEMTRLILEESSLSRIIFMSGYSDFEYAQQAIRLGAFDFIQKPFMPSQIVDVVLKAKQSVMLELVRLERLKDMESKVRESMPVLRQEFFRMLLQVPSSLTSVEERWNFLEIDLERHDFIVMLIEVDRFASLSLTLPIQEVELVRFTIQNIIEETIGSSTKGLMFRENLHQFVAVINPSAREDAEAIAERCREHIARYSHYTVSIGIGSPVREVQDIALSYQQAVTALSYSFYTGGDSVYSFRNLHAGRTPSRRPEPELEKELLYNIRLGNEEKALEWLERIFAESRREGEVPDPGSLKTVYYELAFMMNRVIAEKMADGDMAELEEKLADIQRDSGATLTGLQAKMTDFCRAGCEWVRRQQTKEANQQVDHVIDYIRTHIDANLSVGDYAKMVYLSSSYFSNLFKKVTGMTITQFVTSERMEKAKELLIQGMQVQEISLQLGYEDRPYFSELFKRHTGMTPSEFRQLYEPGK
ncbi:helix-turn-helix domain-containing protein [Paenibacillus puerhi]|uniref:helix-turn-helix domain-containing protein n=1 Tax=Paenibacillus puerhi TaxID=2692622 RepID=UPI00135B3AA3|nr:helix-turn-helix domain-containing protein [Paenibacillus puerhi]